MKNRKIAVILAAAILSGVTGCSAQKPSESTSITEPSVSSEITSSVSSSGEVSANEITQNAKTQKQAYGEVIQDLVNKYGVVDKQMLQSTDYENKNLSGLISIMQYDLTGDGQEELILLYASEKVGAPQRETLGQDIHLEIYTFNNNKAVQLYSKYNFIASLGVSNFSVCSVDGQNILFSGSTRHFTEHILYYKDRKILDAVDYNTHYSEQEQQIYDEGIQYGLSGEGEALNKIYLMRAGFNYDSLQYIHGISSDIGTFGLSEYDSLIQTLNNFDIKTPKKIISAQDLLNNIEYMGDKSICKMDSQMATAYANILDSLPNEVRNLQNLIYTQFSDDEIKVMLCDFAGDGYPVLAVFCGGEDSFLQLWGYENGKAVNANIIYPTRAVMGDVNIGKINDKTVLEIGQYISYSGGSAEWEFAYYQISNGKISTLHDLHYAEQNSAFYMDMTSNYDPLKLANERKDAWADGYRLLLDSYPCYPNDYFNHDQTLCDSNVISNCGRMFKITDFEKIVTDKFLPLSASPNDEMNTFDDSYTGFTDRKSLEFNTPIDREVLKTFLLSYSQSYGKPSYSFTEVSHMFSDDELKEIAKLYADKLNGEIGEIYQVSDDIYYIVIYIDGKVCGSVTIKKIISDGNITYRLINSSSEIETEENLKSLADTENDKSNITLNYSDSGDNKAEYLENALQNIDGTSINDIANGQISSYIENAVTDSSMIDIDSNWNKITITDKIILESLENAQAEKSKLEQVIDGITLNKEVKIILRIVCTGLNDGKTIEVTFDKSMLNAMDGVSSVQVMLSDAQHSVAISKDTLQKLCDKYGHITVKMQNKDGKYLISFEDSEGNVIDKLENGLNFTLPAENETATILASYGKQSDNWGGQFDSINKALEFSTPYTGTYEVMENQIDISDIADLDEQTANAIRFMVSKGYFSLDENGNFLPNEQLNRYEFAEALVRMFFTLDRELETTFTDVPKDSKYYDFVASGEQDAIIEGFEDNTFRGENSVPFEQVIAFCSRTLADKKGYSYPANPSEYLKFTDNSDISEWAVDTTALAVREKLIESSGTLEPQKNISRSEAAVILYKLFMLLYEPPVTAMDIDDTSTNIPVIPIAAGTGVILASGIGGFIFWKKRKVNK